MKITAIEIKPGMIIEHKNDYWNVLKTQHVKPGKGGAYNQVELKSIIKGTKLNERFRSSETVEKAEVEEKKFDPNFHQAMSEIEDDRKDPGTILNEIQAGYMLGDRLLRPALVSVSKKKASKEQENKDKKSEK